MSEGTEFASFRIFILFELKELSVLEIG